MTRRAMSLAVLMVLVCLAVSANTPPTAEGSQTVTIEGTPVRIELRAHDPDIDPLNPGAHPLRFVLIDGPAHGVLLGDLAEVRYESPSTAVVALTYIPAAGFVGTERLLFAVFDPHEATAAGLVQIDVIRYRPPPQVSGVWSLGMSWLPETGEMSAFASAWTVAYRVGGLLLKSTARLRLADLGGGKQVVLEVVRLEGDVRGEGVTLASTLAFKPQATSPFDYLAASARFSLGNIAFNPGFHLTVPLASSFGTLRVQGLIAEVSVAHVLRFDLDASGLVAFARSETTVAGRWCDLRLGASLLFTKAGFEHLRLSFTGFPLSDYLPGYLAGLVLDVRVTYTVANKDVRASLDWQPPWRGCIRLYGGLELGGPGDLALGGAEIYGVRIECSWENVKFVSATSFVPMQNSLITGQSDYWEVVRVSGTFPGCCAKVPGAWSFATYFYTSGAQLFGWGMTTATLDLWPYDALNLTLNMAMRSGELGDPRSEVSMGFALRW